MCGFGQFLCFLVTFGVFYIFFFSHLFLIVFHVFQLVSQSAISSFILSQFLFLSSCHAHSHLCAQVSPFLSSAPFHQVPRCFTSPSVEHRVCFSSCLVFLCVSLSLVTLFCLGLFSRLFCFCLFNKVQAFTRAPCVIVYWALPPQTMTPFLDSTKMENICQRK